VLLFGVVFSVLGLSSTALLPSGDGSVGSTRPFINSQYALTSFFALSGFVVYSFFAAVLGGLTVIRDDENRVSELLHSTPLTAAEYIGGKFAGALLSLVLVLVLHTSFAMVFFEVVPGHGPVGPFHLRNYLVPALIFGLPPIVLFAGLAFAVGEWTRKPMMVFAIPIAIVFALPFFFTWSPPWLSPSADRLLMILDPSGLRWLTRVALGDGPTVAFVNTAAVSFDGTFVFNRVLHVGLAVGAVLATIPHARTVIARGGAAVESAVGSAVRLRLGIRGRRKWPGPTSPASSGRQLGASRLEDLTQAESARLHALQMTNCRPGLLSSTVHMARAEIRELVSQPALYLFVPLLVALIFGEATSAYGPFEEPLILTAGTMAVSTFGILTFVICAVLLFYTVESIHRERVTGFDAILYACPIRTAAFLLAKNIGSAVLVGALLAVAMAATLPMLALQGHGRVEFWPFLLVWGLLMTPTFLVWNAFVTFVLAIVRERYTAYAIGLAALALAFRHLQQESMNWVYNWTLVGTLRWSDFGAFDLNGTAILLNRVLVIATALFLTAVSVRLFARVAPDTTRLLHRLRPANLARASLRTAPLLIAPALIAGVLGLQIRNGFQGQGAADRDKDYWRQNAETWSDVTAPAVTHIDLEIDLEPGERAVTVTGTYSMVNATDEPMRSLAFTARPPFDDIKWTLDGRAIESEDRSGLHVLEPSFAVAPSQSFEIGFVFAAVYPRGLTRNGGGVSQFVLPSGIVLHNLRNSFLPTPGFVEGIGIDRDNYVEPAAVPHNFWQEEQRSPPPYTTRIEITAPSAYTINAVGSKVEERTAGDRTTVVWESDHPVGAVNIVGGRWNVRREGSTAVFFHPGHEYNVGDMLETLVAARERYSEWFYPYPWKELKLSEYPNLDTNAMGFPTNIPFSEGLGFLAEPGAEVDAAFVVTAHEAAHQWWGNVLAAGRGPGTGHLVEGLATYSSLLLLEAQRGVEARIKLARQMETSYLLRRRVALESPVGTIENDQAPWDRAVVYDKGAWVQWMLHNHMGRDNALAGLQDFIRYYVEDGSNPTLQHMIQFLRPHAPDPEAYDTFVEQWFFDIVLPEFKIENAIVTKSGTGWEVSATLENVGSGVVTIAVVATAETQPSDSVRTSDPRSRAISLQLEPGRSTRISFVTDFQPQRLIVDPDIEVLQRNREAASAVLRPAPNPVRQ